MSGDGNQRRLADLPFKRSRLRHEHRLRGYGCERWHADEGRTLLWRWHPHHVARDADASSPDPLHRQHPRPGKGTDGENQVLTPSRTPTGHAVARLLLGFVLVLPPTPWALGLVLVNSSG